jgi:hypothetical protein
LAKVDFIAFVVMLLASQAEALVDKKGETKRQHYVPRMILRNFSTDGKRCSLYILSEGQRVDKVSIANQCYKDYLWLG